VNPVLAILLLVVGFTAGALITFLPRSWEVALGRALGRLSLILDRKRKKIARENMARCLPELSLAQRESLLAENYSHYGILGLELAHYLSPFPGHYRSYAARVASLEGFEHWKAAHARGKGVIFLSAHMANWELMVAQGGLHGIVLSMVTRRLKPAWLYRQFELTRLSVGVKGLYQPNTLPGVMRALRHGESVGFVMDQYMSPPMGSPMSFFGTKVDTLAAIAPLAARTGAAVVPVTQKRETDGLVRIIISPALDLTADLSDLGRTNARLVREIEDMIRANPSQWLWAHRRFKNLGD
jgi:KDO2-lipid IV(A) lauroyltransferase